MSLIKILRAGQITLPAVLRAQFDLSEGSYVEAEATEHGILLKPVVIADRPRVLPPVHQEDAATPDPHPASPHLDVRTEEHA
jgi:AbrB family looped-hinge helix DNA binding protein